MASAMDVDSVVETGVEETKGERVAPTTANGAASTAASGNKAQKGEGDRNIILHPVRSVACFTG